MDTGCFLRWFDGCAGASLNFRNCLGRSAASQSASKDVCSYLKLRLLAEVRERVLILHYIHSHEKSDLDLVRLLVEYGIVSGGYPGEIGVPKVECLIAFGDLIPCPS